LELGKVKDSENVWSSLAFSRSSGFTPIQMEVQRGSKARGYIPARVCLLGRDKSVYKTYALPEDWEAAEEVTAKGDVSIESHD
jgi:anaphase-promoting complex subunit 4